MENENLYLRQTSGSLAGLRSEAFERAINDQLDLTIDSVQQALDDARMSPDDVGQVGRVGKSTCTSLIQRAQQTKLRLRFCSSRSTKSHLNLNTILGRYKFSETPIFAYANELAPIGKREEARAFLKQVEDRCRVLGEQISPR